MAGFEPGRGRRRSRMGRDVQASLGGLLHHVARPSWPTTFPRPRPQQDSLPAYTRGGRRAPRRTCLYQEARAAIHLRDEFLSVASHELKTPLTPLSLKLQMLAREARQQPESPLRRFVEDYVAIGSKQVKKLSELVSDLLDVSRIAGGRLRVEFEEVDLGSLIREGRRTP